ncbi:MAG: biotin--[acetyl-CoA-carboxylase] ligase [Gallionella sp.]
MTKGAVHSRTWQLLDMLADGEFHSGEVLAGRLGVSRASVFNALAEVGKCDVDLHRVRGRGYRLARPWQRLERDEIVRWLGKEAGTFDIEIMPQATSSNALLLQRARLDGMTRYAQAPGAGMPSPRLTPARGTPPDTHATRGLGAVPQSAGSAITSDLASVVGLPSRMASSSISNVSEADVADGGAPSGSVLAVELQTAGRGRMGRNWHSGLGATLTFSLLWRFACGLNALSGLSLAVGVAQVRALNKLGAQGVRLKWPNDILTEQGKLGGVLIEAQGDMLGPSAVVIGIGLNCTLPAKLVKRIDQPASALDEVCAVMPTRSQLLATLLLELANVLRQFEQGGFALLRAEWESCHIHQNSQVRVRMPDGGTVNGIARGVSDSGELRLETTHGIQHLNSGEVGGRP